MDPWKRWLRFSHEVMFARQLAFGVYFLKLFGNNAESQRLEALLETAAAGTVGRALREFLHSHGYRLVPGYERHDLKHVLLGYSSAAPDEMRMQAFMTGNAGFGKEALIALIFLPWTPDAWPSLPRHYLAGRFAARVGGRGVAETAAENLDQLRASLGLEAAFQRADELLAAWGSRPAGRVKRAF